MDELRKDAAERYPEGYNTDVQACARCGQKHEGIRFLPLMNALDEWQFWAVCPIFNKPILGAIAPTQKSIDSMEAWKKKQERING